MSDKIIWPEEVQKSVNDAYGRNFVVQAPPSYAPTKTSPRPYFYLAVDNLAQMRALKTFLSDNLGIEGRMPDPDDLRHRNRGTLEIEVTKDRARGFMNVLIEKKDEVAAILEQHKNAPDQKRHRLFDFVVPGSVSSFYETLARREKEKEKRDWLFGKPSLFSDTPMPLLPSIFGKKSLFGFRDPGPEIPKEERVQKIAELRDNLVQALNELDLQHLSPTDTKPKRDVLYVSSMTEWADSIEDKFNALSSALLQQKAKPQWPPVDPAKDSADTPDTLKGLLDMVDDIISPVIMRTPEIDRSEALPLVYLKPKKLDL